MPYRAAARTKYSVNSDSLTATDSALTIESSKNSREIVALTSSLTSARCLSSSNLPSFSKCSLTSASIISAGNGISTMVVNFSTSKSLACAPCSISLSRVKRVDRSTFNSANVSNSDANLAKASSTGGSSRSFTALTLTFTVPFSPSAIPTNAVSKLLLSPALNPISASSKPSIIEAEPTS